MWAGNGRRSLGVVVVLVGALLACKRKAPDPTPTTTAPTESPLWTEAKKLRPEVKTRLGQIKALEAKAKSEPPVRTDKPFKEKLEEEKFVIVGDKYLADVHYTKTDKELEIRDTTLSLCDYDQENKADPTADDVSRLKECAAWTHAAVIRPRKVSFPKMNMSAKTFAPGEIDGDMLLFELSSGEIKGRYKVVTTNSDKVTYIEGKPEDEWQKVANDDLVTNVTGVTEERLKLERDSMYR